MIFKQISVFSLSVLLFAILTSEVLAQSSLPGLKVSDNKRFLVTESGQPFYWQGDTAWQLQRATPAEVVTYMNDRASKGFTVIQGPTLTGDTDVKSGTNYRGDRNDNPSSPNAAWFEHIDYIIDQATNRGMYVAPVVIWATQSNRISSTTQAYNYGVWLGTKYRNYTNIIWIVAGEYAAGSLDSNTLNKWKQLAQGLKDGSQNRHLVTIHGSWGPNDADRTSSTYFHNESWLDFNMWQTSQDPWKESWPLITSDYNKTPTKPVVDGEPTYEGWWEVTNYNFNSLGTRRRAYWAVFAGAFGYTYGAHGIWDWHKPGESSTTGDQWSVALNFEGSADMQHVKNLILSRPFSTRIPDQGLIVGGAGSGWDHMHATRDSSGSYAFVYVPNPNQNITIDTSKLTGSTLRVWWYNARTGSATDQGTINRTGGSYTFTSPSGGDSVLVVDDSSKGYGTPGVVGSQPTTSPTPTVAPTVAPTISPTPVSTPSPSPNPSSPTRKPGDANGDSKVDGLDYVIWLTNYDNQTSQGPNAGDFNTNGKVDGLDYVIWLTNYNVDF